MKSTLIKDWATVKRNPRPSLSELVKPLKKDGIEIVDLVTEECYNNNELEKEGKPPVISQAQNRMSMNCQPRYTYQSQTQPDLSLLTTNSKSEPEERHTSSPESSRTHTADPNNTTEHRDTQVPHDGQGKVEDLLTFLGDSIEFI